MTNPALLALFSQLAEPFTAEALFDGLNDIVFFIKDQQGRYVLVNTTLAKRCGLSDKGALLGHTAAETTLGPLGSTYLAQDLEIISTGQALLNELELHAYPTGEPGWCLTTKLPLKNAQGKCVGLVGMSRDLHAPTEDYRDVAEALRFAHAQLETPLTVEELAKRAGLSPFQLDQRVRDVFHLSVTQLLLKFRMDRATQRLRDSTKPIAQIALECGYSDQSAFTRQFGRTIGLSPGEYRKVYQR